MWHIKTCNISVNKIVNWILTRLINNNNLLKFKGNA